MCSVVRVCVGMFMLGTMIARGQVAAPTVGRLNTYDLNASRGLIAARAAIDRYKAYLVAGKVPETRRMQAQLNKAIGDYDAAVATYTAWRAKRGQSTSAPVSTAMTTMKASVNTLGR